MTELDNKLTTCQTCGKENTDVSDDWGDCKECVAKYILCERCETPTPPEEGDLCDFCQSEGWISQAAGDMIYEQLKEEGYGRNKA